MLKCDSSVVPCLMPGVLAALQIKVGFFESGVEAKESWDVDAKIGKVGLYWVEGLGFSVWRLGRLVSTGFRV